MDATSMKTGHLFLTPQIRKLSEDKVTVSVELQHCIHIEDVARGLISLARKTRKRVLVCLHDVNLEIDPEKEKDSPEAVVGRYYRIKANHDIERILSSSAQWFAGLVAKKEELESRGRELVEELSSIPMEDYKAIMTWLIQFEPVTNFSGVNWDRSPVLQYFRDFEAKHPFPRTLVWDDNVHIPLSIIHYVLPYLLQ